MPVQRVLAEPNGNLSRVAKGVAPRTGTRTRTRARRCRSCHAASRSSSRPRRRARTRRTTVRLISLGH